MAVTLEQMATAYVQTIQAELNRAKDILKENEKVVSENNEYIASVDSHLQECLALIDAGKSESIVGGVAVPPQVKDNPVTTVESAVPENPFVSI